MSASLNRRDFIKAAGATGAAVAMASGTTIALADETQPEPLQIMPGDLTALGEAPEIAEADIAQTKDCDILVIGAGLTGLCAARSAAEAGAKVIVLEKNAQIEIHGFGCGVVNSTFALDLGIEVDPAAVMNEYERRSYGRVNMPLVSLWANHSGEAFDWYSSVADDFVKENMTLNYYPPFEEHDTTKDQFQTFLGCIDFKEDPLKQF